MKFDNEIMRAYWAEIVRKCWADASYQSGLELLEQGEERRAQLFILDAYATYEKLEDNEGMRKCLKVMPCNRVPEGFVHVLGDGLAKIINDRLDTMEGDTPEKMVEGFKKGMLKFCWTDV